MPRAGDDVPEGVVADVQVRFLEEDKRKTARAALQLVFADLSDDIDDRLQKALPGEIRQVRNIDHQCTTMTDSIVLGLQRGGFMRMLREDPSVPRCFETTANGRTHPFILGKL